MKVKLWCGEDLHRNVISWLFITLHTLACIAYVYVAASEEFKIKYFATGDFRIPNGLSWEYKKVILYVGYGFINSIFGVVTGVLLFMKPKEDYNNFLKVWICFALIVLITTFMLLSFLEVPLRDRLLMMTFTVALYACAYGEIVGEERSSRETCQSIYESERMTDEESRKMFISSVRIIA